MTGLVVVDTCQGRGRGWDGGGSVHRKGTRRRDQQGIEKALQEHVRSRWVLRIGTVATSWWWLMIAERLRWPVVMDFVIEG